MQFRAALVSVMKKSLVAAASACLVSFLHAAPVSLPEVVPGPFAPVPAKPGAGPDAPAAPMERKAPVWQDCANAAAVIKCLGVRLTERQRQQLDADRFLLLPVEATALGEKLPETDDEREWAFTQDEMLSAFAMLGGDPSPAARAPGQARLVTPDLALHAWHRGFARVLESTEQRRLRAVLAEFLSGSIFNARDLRAAAKGELAERIAWTEARFAAPWILLGDPPPPEPSPDDPPPGGEDGTARKPAPLPYADAVKKRLGQASAKLPPEVAAALAKEIGLVLAAEGFERSPLFGKYAQDKPADYSQFKPRSHYTKNDTLGGYFRSMMFLGRNGYQLSNTDAIGDALLAAVVMARARPGGSMPITAWRQVMEVTGFFAGQSDDITFPELREWIGATLGVTALDPVDATDAGKLGKLSAKLSGLRPPLICSDAHLDQLTSPDSDPPSFRVCGQRFTWDARVLDRVTRGSPREMPTTPTTAMIPAAFGDEFAAKVARDYLTKFPDDGTKYAAEFDRRLPEIRKEIDSVTDAGWFASMAAKQLHAMSMLARPRNGNFPAFMRNDAFRAKNLVSFLGSYTELKHDTVLYAKQVYAEAGEGGDSDKKPPPPHGFVQPDVPFWREIERLAVFAADGMERHQLLPDAAEEYSRFRVFARHISAFRKIAEKEVAGAKLTEQDWETIRTTDLSYMAEPMVPMDQPKPGDGKCALATDVLTDAGSGTVLHQALGRPLVMIALVGGNGGNRMVAGLAYRHFEFSRPMGEGRLTDEEWQAQVYQVKPKLPPPPEWHAPVSVPERDD